MSKLSVTTKNSSAPSQSAWARGPPQTPGAVPPPVSSTLASVAVAPSPAASSSGHQRKPSNAISVKDGPVSVRAGAQPSRPGQYFFSQYDGAGRVWVGSGMLRVLSSSWVGIYIARSMIIGGRALVWRSCCSPQQATNASQEAFGPTLATGARCYNRFIMRNCDLDGQMGKVTSPCPLPFISASRVQLARPLEQGPRVASGDCC